MEPDYWHTRWREGRTGWHQEAATPLLVEHWSAIGAEPGCVVFVPLAGKSHDMHWLVAHGHRVLGVELSRMAIEQFFDEAGLHPTTFDSPYGVHFRAGAIELICGDAFSLDRAVLAQCAAVYDRAAMIALPHALRMRYIRTTYHALPPGCRGLLVTLDYPPHEKAGPPFPVDDAEVRARLAPDWDLERIAHRDILSSQPGFVAEGVTRLDTSSYRIRRR